MLQKSPGRIYVGSADRGDATRNLQPTRLLTSRRRSITISFNFPTTLDPRTSENVHAVSLRALRQLKRSVLESRI